MNKFLIIGDRGSMGRRYAALLRHAGEHTCGVDIDTPMSTIARVASGFSHVIVATPTDTHYEMLLGLAKSGANILCEKPITKKLDELEHILDVYRDKRLEMVMQYRELDIGKLGDSFYDYYNHGRDGIYWDCLQIIGLARGRVMLSECSPFWKCRLNGVDLDITKMDYAYSWMLKRWMRNPKGEFNFLRDVHIKVKEMEQNERPSRAEVSSGRDTSPFY